MEEGYFIDLTDDEGNSFKLEIVGEVEYEGETYVVFLPADMDENDPDYGFVILKSVDNNGEEMYDSVDDEDLLQRVYDLYMQQVFAEDEAAESDKEGD